MKTNLVLSVLAIAIVSFSAVGQVFATGDFSDARLRAYDRALHQRYDATFLFSRWARNIGEVEPHILNGLVRLFSKQPELARLFANRVLGQRPMHTRAFVGVQGGFGKKYPLEGIAVKYGLFEGE